MSAVPVLLACRYCGGPFDEDGWCDDNTCRGDPARPLRRCVIRGCGRRTRRLDWLCEEHYAPVSDPVIEAWLLKIHPLEKRLPEKAKAPQGGAVTINR